MRTVAIVLVLFVHSELITQKCFPHFKLMAGLDGVDFFFVLSGFLIGRILIKSFIKEKVSFSILVNFWKRRWFRTLPNYFLILIFLLIFDFSDYTSSKYFETEFLFFFQNFNWPHPSFYNVAWSLSVEEWFYILFPLSIFISIILSTKIKFKNSFLFLIVIFYLFSSLYRILYFNFNNVDDAIFLNLIRKAVLFRFDTIIMGVLASWIYFFYYSKWIRFKNIIFLLGILLIILHIIYYQNTFYRYYFSINFSAFGIALLLPYLSELKCRYVLPEKIITHISHISYSIYLTHFSIVLIVKIKGF